MPENTEILRGEHVLLRPLTAEDAGPLAELLRHEKVAVWWGDGAVEEVMADFLDSPHTHSFIIESEGKVAGLIAFTEEVAPDYRHAGIDITVAGDLLRRGLGTDAMRTLMDHLIRVRGHHRLTVDPAAANSGAIAFYKYLGFRKVGTMHCYERGTDGEWHDGLLMEYVTC